MQIDIIKLIKNLLPTFVLNNVLVQILFVLISEARISFNAFIQSVPGYKYKARANASVLSLQKTIKQELDVDAVITELDGKPIDFLVTVSGQVDIDTLKRLIDTNKLAGKSYVFTLGNLKYTAEFINHACEQAFIDNQIFSGYDVDGGNEIYYIGATSEVLTGLSVRVKIWKSSENGGLPYEMNVVIPAGETKSIDIGTNLDEVWILEVTPEYDTYYHYKHN